jgi:hypothetical protein
MSAKTARSKQDAEKLLQKSPALVLFYMIGCPHCEANEPAWKEAKERVKKESPDTEIVEIEADNTPMSAGVHSFPTMIYKSRGGDEKKVEGAQQNANELLDGVGWKSNPLKSMPAPDWKKNPLSKKGSSRRRRGVTRRLTNARLRKFRHRTLRNYVPLVK